MAKTPPACSSTLIFVLAVLGFSVAYFLMMRNKHEGFQNNAYRFIMYYSPRCGHCIKAKPEFQKLGGSQMINGKTVLISMVDPNAEPNMVISKSRVTGYPTFHLYGHDSELISQYKGLRQQEKFIEFLNLNVR